MLGSSSRTRCSCKTAEQVAGFSGVSSRPRQRRLRLNPAERELVANRKQLSSAVPGAAQISDEPLQADKVDRGRTRPNSGHDGGGRVGRRSNTFEVSEKFTHDFAGQSGNDLEERLCKRHFSFFDRLIASIAVGKLYITCLALTLSKSKLLNIIKYFQLAR